MINGIFRDVNDLEAEFLQMIQVACWDTEALIRGRGEGEKGGCRGQRQRLEPALYRWRKAMAS